jgi:two-component system LytT family sensor kinase
MPTEDMPTPPLALRTALLSIFGFWAFYFTILTTRALLIYANHTGLANRAIVSLVSVGITVLFYLLMRRVPAARLGRSIATAAMLAVPATILYSVVDWYVFDYREHPAPLHWTWSPPAAPAAPTPPIRMGGMVVPAPPAPPAPPQSVSVGKMAGDDDMTPLQSIVDQAVNGYFFFASWAALYLALCYAGEVGALERRAANLRAAAQSAELRALRYQVNPHFLFNTLNSLSSLVLSGKRDEAEHMIISLSTFFRTSLTGDPTEDVPLAEEIRLQRLYLDIEAVRFPDRLIVAFDIPENLEGACIPGLILQPLVENAVKYGVARARRPVTIRIVAREEADRLLLTVEDDGDPMDPDADAGGTGVGLQNVRNRLAARFGGEAFCRWGPKPGRGFAVHLVLPMVGHDC